MSKEVIKFIRRKDYEKVEDLGRGSCGRTVLLNDPIIDEKFVCKKYSPMHDEFTVKLYKRFVKEIKFLYMINHSNIVRIFNYHLYPKENTGYILMEYIDGVDIEDYLKKYPENIDSLFEQVIEAFHHLELSNILHRDIRPTNILVSNKGEAKVIDFGFSKEIRGSKDFDKSVSLNWWCEIPAEFKEGTYDHATEVYFVGKLFEKIISECQLEQFMYKDLLGQMVLYEPEKRVKLFSNIRNEILSEKFADLEFDSDERQVYRNFSDMLAGTLHKIEHSTKYVEPASEISRKLEKIYKSLMLEEYVPDNAKVLRALLSGEYYLNKHPFKVFIFKEFVELIRQVSTEKRNIIVANLQTRMDAIERYHKKPDFEDDIPF